MYSVYYLADVPDMRARATTLKDAWPKFMDHDTVADLYWERLFSEFAEYQFYITDDDCVVLAEGNTIPIRWEKPLSELPEEGWDWALELGFKQREAGIEPNVLCALSATIGRPFRSTGLSRTVLMEMRRNTLRHGLEFLIAPVRPYTKQFYPLIPMEDYVQWLRPDGYFFDDWMRTHQRLGAKFVKVAPRSMHIAGPLKRWEAWTGLAFPGSGTYIVPGGIAPVCADRKRDEAVYIEPNVWMVHPAGL